MPLLCWTGQVREEGAQPSPRRKKSPFGRERGKEAGAKQEKPIEGVAGEEKAKALREHQRQAHAQE